MSALDRALAYLAKLPIAVSGSEGSKATMLAARSCRRLGLSESDMWQALSWYNDNRCSPPWTEKELRHKLAGVLKTENTRPLAPSFGRRQPPKPVKADALRERMGFRMKAADAPAAPPTQPSQTVDTTAPERPSLDWDGAIVSVDDLPSFRVQHGLRIVRCEWRSGERLPRLIVEQAAK